MAPNSLWIIWCIKGTSNKWNPVDRYQRSSLSKPSISCSNQTNISKQVVVMNLRTWLQTQSPSWYRIKLRKNFAQQVSLCRMQRALLENTLNCPHLTPLGIMISLADAPLLEILFRKAMTCARLEHVTKIMTRHATHKSFQWIEARSSIHIPLRDGVVLAQLTQCFLV